MIKKSRRSQYRYGKVFGCWPDGLAYVAEYWPKKKIYALRRNKEIRLSLEDFLKLEGRKVRFKFLSGKVVDLSLLSIKKSKK